MNLKLGNLLLLFTLIATSVMAQSIVDATGPHKKPEFGTTGGTGGGVGRMLPVQLAIELAGTPFNVKGGRTTIDFVLTNTGQQELIVPLSADGSDLQSVNSFRELSLCVTVGKRGNSWGKDRQLLQTGTELRNQFVQLYGSNVIPGTLGTLAPGQSIRVRAEVALPHVFVREGIGTSLVGRVMMYDVDIRTSGNKRLMDSREVGIATSPEYTSEALLKSHD